MKKHPRFLKLKFFCMIWVLVMASAHATAIASSQPVSVRLKNVTLHEVIWELEKQTTFNFIYNTAEVKAVLVKELTANNADALEVLRSALAHSRLTIEVHDEVVIIKTDPSIKNVSETLQQQPQGVTVRGNVVDKSGVPVVGAYVMVEGASAGTSADMDGAYTITAPSNGKLIFSSMGFKTLTIEVSSRTTINVTMEEDASMLEEVVVTGFGNLQRFSVAGSASIVKTDNMKGIPNQSVATMIQASAPGVSVTSFSGQPGGVESIRIRGYGSFNASNSPLYVIDGVPVLSGDINDTGRSAGTDAMATLNPNDISNITVIKDAAAASLWGSRAANGIILITTKQGAKDRMRVSFSSDFGQSDFAYRYRPVMGGEERRQFIYDSYMRRGMNVNNLSETEAKKQADQEFASDAARALPRWSVEPWSGWTDWVAESFRKGSHNNQDISLSGGSDKFSYYTSFSHTNTKGVQYMQELDRITGRINVSFNASRWFKLGGNLMFSDMDQSLGYDENDYVAPIYAAFVKTTPADVVYLEDGSLNRDNFRDANGRNTVLVSKYAENKQRVTRAFNTVFAEAKAFPTLSFKTTFSYDFTMSKGSTWNDPMLSSTAAAANGQVGKTYTERRNILLSTNANYVNTFGNNHNVDALVAYEIMNNYEDYLSANQDNFVNLRYREIGNGSVPRSISGYYGEDRMISYISRVNYNWKHRYNAGVSFRMDGTSRLHANSRWGSFWSVSGGWRFSSEKFMSSIRNIITNGMLRASFGTNGTRPSGRYAYMSLVSLSNSYNGQVAMMEDGVPNNNLKWEKNEALNLGLDVMIVNRIDITFEYYNRTTKDLLMDLAIPLTTGFSSSTTNVGSMRNSGIEFTLNSSNISNKEMSWNTQFNISHNKNEILKFDGVAQERAASTSSMILKIGYPYYQYNVVEYSHINPENGRAMFFMNNELPDGTVNRELTDRPTDATRVLWKSPFPKVRMGLTNNFKWKFIDLVFTFSSTLGGYSYDVAYDKNQTSGAGDALINQISVFYRDSWKQPGDHSKYEAWIPGNSYSMRSTHNTRNIHSTDHVRLKNFTIGISLPHSLATKLKLEQMRVYFSGHNLWTLAAYNEYDPEVPNDGRMHYNTPPLKSYSLGININL